MSIIVPDYDGLVNLLRSRIDELQISNDVLDEISGLAKGYSGKLFGRSRSRMIGVDSLWVLLQSLGLQLRVEVDMDAVKRMESRWEKREEIRRRVGFIRKRYSPEIKQQIMRENVRENGQKGGLAWAAKLTPEQRSQHAKKLAGMRWRKGMRSRSAAAPAPS